jgi:sarcosine oxidase subunit alpha
VTGYRLDPIPEAESCTIRFDGQRITARRGETLAAALLGAGTRVVARSFKYHRPRGVVGFGLDEPNALVTTREHPAILATRLSVTPDLAAHAVNAWPNARWDLRAVHGLFARFMPAGFYYKTFIAGGWRLWEKRIRDAAGLARLRTDAPPLATEKQNIHVDVLIVGAGIAGLAAACDAARNAKRVLLIDDGDAPGGYLRDRTELEDHARIAALVAELDASPQVRRLARALVTGLYDDGLAFAVERAPGDGLDERLLRIRAREVILATGAIERPLIFAGNDRPGVMLLSAMRGYAERYGIACGHRVVVFTNNDGAYREATALKRRGVDVAMIVDRRRDIAAVLRRDTEAAGIALRLGHSVLDTHYARGLHGICIAPIEDLASTTWIDCDALAMAGGWTPQLQLHAQAGGTTRYDDRLGAFVPDQAAPGVTSLGSASGNLPYDAELRWEPAPHAHSARDFVDFAADTTSADIRLAAREGFDSVEHMKRYTTTGMALDQGRLGGANAFAVLAEARGTTPGAIGATTFRPPTAPIAFGTLAERGGALVMPARHTPITEWNIREGAVMYDVAAHWRRPGYYKRGAESLDAAVHRECLNARTKVGLYDGSPLGKFEMKGRDVLTFLERLYANDWRDLAPGEGRYGLMLHEDGRVFDDGVGFRLAADRFLIHTTTGNADSAAARFEYFRQIEWPELEVMITNVTAQWANLCVCGPLAREVLRDVGTDLDLASQDFPFMTLRERHVAGIAARIARVSFTGELSFEINVAARRGLELWERLMTVGARYGIQPIGSEGSHVLRIEKGFISVGHEADGIADPHDLGLNWIVSKTKADFIGNRALNRNRELGGARPQMVGLLGADPKTVLPESAVVLSDDGTSGRGFVAASCFSPILERGIAIAMIENGRALMNTSVTIARGAERFIATIVRPSFFDPKGERMRG